MPASIAPERRSIIRGYCEPWMEIVAVPFDAGSGLLDLDALRPGALGDDVACVYVENPGYLGVARDAGRARSQTAAHEAGALAIVGVDPISLGVLEAPPRYGADIVCGELQPLGIHMHYGGGLAGFVATPDEERFVAEYPTFLVGLAPTAVAGEYGLRRGRLGANVLRAARRGQGVRRHDRRTSGRSPRGVYLSLLGPQGLAELGEGHHAARRATRRSASPRSRA